MYMVTGPMLIIQNNAIMKEHGFPYPLALSAIGLVSSAAVAHLVVAMGWGEINDLNREAVAGKMFWEKLAPVGFMYALSLGFGNAAYIFLNVGFIQMMKVRFATLIYCLYYMITYCLRIREEF